MYIGEISPPTLRGILVSFPQFAITIGVLLVYLLGAIPGFSYEYIALVAVAIAAVFVLLLAPPWIPMTPRYLLMKGRWEEALKELKWLRGPQVSVAEEAEETKQVIVSVKKLSWKKLCTELYKRKSLISFTLMLAVMAFQQLSGINALVFFAGDTFKSAGFDNAQLLASFAIGVVSVVVTLVSVVLVDLFGRKILLLASGFILSVSSFGLGTNFYLTQNCAGESNMTETVLLLANNSSSLCNELKPLVIGSIMLYTLGFAIGWGSIPFILISELFPLQTSGFLAGLVSMVNWGCAALVSGTYNWIAELVHSYGAWWTFGIINIISSACVAVFLPETRGKKLEDIEDQLQNRYRLCVWR